jgi:hypothetical protein
MYSHLFVRLSVCSSVCQYLSVIFLSICPSVHPSACLSVCLSICPSLHPSFCLSVLLSVCQSTCLSVNPSTHPSFYSPVCLCVYLPVCLSISVYVCVHVCPSFHTRLSVCLSAYPPVCQSAVCLSVCLSDRLFICLSLHLSICMSVRLSLLICIHPSVRLFISLLFTFEGNRKISFYHKRKKFQQNGSAYTGNLCCHLTNVAASIVWNAVVHQQQPT